MPKKRICSLTIWAGCMAVFAAYSSDRTATELDVAGGPSRPNVVLIYADDLGWGDLSVNGGKTPTPNIDRIFHQGVRFNSFSTHTVCSPSRAGLLTGRHYIHVTTPGGQPLKTEASEWLALTIATFAERPPVPRLDSPPREAGLRGQVQWCPGSANNSLTVGTRGKRLGRRVWQRWQERIESWLLNPRPLSLPIPIAASGPCRQFAPPLQIGQSIFKG